MMWFGYCRVSTAEQAADGRTSLEEQERVIRGAAMAEGVGSYDLQVLVDAGVSGSIPLRDRPQGKRIFEAREGDTVIVSKLDRLFRNALDAHATYERFQEAGIHLVIFEYGIKPITSEDSMARLFFSILTTFADFERVRIRERMAEGKEAKRRRGGHTGGEALFGYRIEGSGREARQVPYEPEQEVLRAVRDLPPGIRPAEATRQLCAVGAKGRGGKHLQIVQVQRLMARVQHV